MDHDGASSAQREDKGKGPDETEHNNNNKKGRGGKKKGKDDKEPAAPMVPFFDMFRYATPLDKLLMALGSLGAALNGAIMPAFAILIGQLNDVFSPDKFNKPNYSLEHEITPIALYFLYVGIGAFVLSYVETGFWMMAGERQIRRIRENYLRAVLRQEIGWFDISKPSEISTRIASDTAAMQDAIGEKVGNFIHQFSTFIAGFVVGFVQGWQLTLVILAVTPLLGAAGMFMAVTLSSMTKRGLEAYAGAGGVAEECISNIRTVTTFNAYKKESDRYTTKLREALSIGLKKGYVTGAGMAMMMFVMFSTYSLAFWFGSKLIADHTRNSTTGKPWTGGDVVTTFFAVVMGAFAMGQAGPSMQAFGTGRAAAYKIFSIINRQSKIDPFDPSGERPKEVIGDVEFRDVYFNYPSRPDVPILLGLNLSIPRGKTVALVGESGCGKSTTVGLLEKFYLADQGSIFLDERDINTLNTKWLRQNLGMVSQEPQLFATSIAENIRFGKEDATMDEIIEAAKGANAHDFISKLPSAYDTLVGEKGVQMSGGQKQRIAIARAIIKNPSILLLDEATSALDTENERLVQEALDRLMVGRTTIVIAHRLATVKHADKIVVIKEGKAVEQGKHDELMALNGLYYHLVHKQTKNHEEEKERVELDERHDVGVSQMEDIMVGASSDSITPMLVHSSEDLEKGGQEVEKAKPYPFSYKRLIRESRPELPISLLGIVAACTNGTVMPIFAIIYSEIVTTFQKPDPRDVRKGANFLAAMFICLAVGAGLANFIQLSCFTAVGERLTFRLRDSSFRSILRQNIGWFDLDKNATGVLTTKLATDATLVQGVTTQRVSLIFQNTATIVAGLVIAFVAGWKLTLVILAVLPFLVISSSMQMKFIKGFAQDSQLAYEKAGTVSTEAVGQIRTVASFTKEDKLLAMYSERLEEPTRLGTRKAHVSGIGFGAAQFCMFAVNTLAFWYGGRLVDQHEWRASQSTIIDQCTKPGQPLSFDQCANQFNALAGFSQMMRVFFAIFMMGMGIGQSSSFAPDAAKASAAASSIYELIDRRSLIDPDQDGAKLAKVEGHIEFKNVHFAYPTRPKMPIFKGFNLVVPPGKTLALVGDSGGGKSTVISLLERFYDPSQGDIFLDGTEIRSMDVKYLRSQISLVSQEPSLFSTTIARNIAYGAEDATLDEIQEAAKLANCHNFIVALPDGYNTLLGDKYTQLSGGQKQRVAIARAILCNPKVMLLDEATSALDSESETLVQEALERVMKGRTTIVIAHRLSTIMDADVIAVMKGGQIVELGTHHDLLAHGGVYTNLIKRQL